MIISALSATIGLVAVSQIDNQFIAVAAVVSWGLGDSGPNPGAGVSIASTLGYIAFLVGPPMLGFLGEAIGLRDTLLAPALFTLAAVGICLLIRRVVRQRENP